MDGYLLVVEVGEGCVEGFVVFLEWGVVGV